MIGGTGLLIWETPEGVSQLIFASVFFPHHVCSSLGLPRPDTYTAATLFEGMANS